MAESLQVGAWRVDVDEDQIRLGDQVVKLEPRLMKMLMVFVSRPGEVIAIQRLLDEVWGDVVVTPDSIYQAIGALRRAFSAGGAEPDAYFVNIPRRGYKLVAPVRRLPDPVCDVQGFSLQESVPVSANPAHTEVLVPEAMPWRSAVVLRAMALWRRSRWRMTWLSGATLVVGMAGIAAVGGSVAFPDRATPAAPAICSDTRVANHACSGWHAMLASVLPSGAQIRVEPTEVQVGSPVTIRWSAPGAGFCTQRGGSPGDGWGGKVPVQGERQLVPTADAYYSVDCSDGTNVNGSGAVRVTLTTPYELFSIDEVAGESAVDDKLTLTDTTTGRVLAIIKCCMLQLQHGFKARVADHVALVAEDEQTPCYGLHTLGVRNLLSGEVQIVTNPQYHCGQAAPAGVYYRRDFVLQ